MTLSLPHIAAAPARTLIVEDEGLVAEHLSELLTASGYEVVGIAESSEDALAQASSLLPDLILMDIHIKGPTDGIETTARLRELLDIPVVYLTAHTDAHTIDRAKTTGAFGFLTKPIQITSLNIAVEMAIHKHRSDRALRHQRSWMATVLGAMPDAMAVIDTEGRIQFLNAPAEGLTGWTREESLGIEIDKVLPLRDPAIDTFAENVFAPPSKPGPPADIPRGLFAVRRSGEGYPIEGAISPSVDNGQVVGAIITFRDATNRQAQDNERRHNDKMQAVGVLAAGIAHDFNNLLLVILGHTEEMLQTTHDDSGLRALNEIRKAGKSASTITQQLLKYSRKQPVGMQAVDLNALISDSEELCRRVAGPGVSWRFRLDRNLGPVMANEEQLKQVLVNLVTNAREAMPLNGRVTVETINVDIARSDSSPDAKERFVALSVTDTGAGMSAATAEHLFEPFFTTKQAGSGAGLGLSIVHSIVTDHGGTIHVDSSPGTGANFTIYFPRAGTSAGLPVAADLDTIRDPAPATILLVEDHEGVRDLLRAYLSGAGYIVLEAGDGDEAMRISEEHEGPIDLLITDVMMPGASGVEIARSIAWTRTAMKMIFISGYARTLAEGSEKLPPEARFLSKPFARNELLQNVSALVAGREMNLTMKAGS